MTFDHVDESENIANIDDVVNLSTSTTQNDNIDKAPTSGEATLSVASSSGIPAIIFKCNHCDFFGQIKQEVEAHIETTHPNTDKDDIISIPTNPVAIQAFQAAMAAATLAAVSRATKPSQTPSPTVSPNIGETKDTSASLVDDDDKEPVAIKRERLDTVEPEVISMEMEQDKNIKSISMEVIETETLSSQDKPQQQNIGVQCPLCQDFFTERNALEVHLMKIHSVNKDGLARLLLLVDTSLWIQNDNTSKVSRSQSAVTETAPSSTSSKTGGDVSVLANQPTLPAYELLVCQQCCSSFKHEQQLLQHAQKMQHYTMQQGEYLCLAFNSVRNPCTMHYPSLAAMFNHYNDTHMRLVISERHVYKYRCKQCSLAFKTQEKLATHTLYHTMRDATKCAMCQRNFRSTQALQKHMEQTHSQTATNSNSLECTSPRTISPSGSEQEKPSAETSQTVNNNEKFENESSRSVTPGQDMCPPIQSPSLNQNDPQNSTPPSVQQQQQISALTALINQQQQTAPPSDLLHHLQMQHQQFQNLPALHNLQQQLPQFAAAVAASGMPLNPVEMLNLMQFHHLISLNFMNLAPPLIFGGNNTPSTPAPSSSVAGSNNTTPINMPNNNAPQASSHVASTDLTTSSSATSTNTSQSMTALPNVEVNTQILQQQQISPGASTSQLLNNQKRARTRITDDQLKILRAHFDINNSPSEESILEMSHKANLPMKVVKHWFRNTLFKERQRNKDSPYNFNNPPSTTLNLEEYERTGQAKVIPLTEQVQQQQQQQLQIPSRPSSAHSISNISEYSNQQQNPQQQQIGEKQREEAETLRSQASSVASSTFPLDVQIKTEIGEDLIVSSNSMTAESPSSTMATLMKQQQQKLRLSSMEAAEHDLMMMSDQHLSSAAVAAQQQQHAAAVAAATFYNSYDTKSESESSDIHSRPQSPNSNTTSNLYASMNDLLGQQLENMPHNQMGPPKKFQLNTNSNPCSNLNTATSERTTIPGVPGSNSGSASVAVAGGITVSTKLFEKHSPSAQYDTNSNSSNSSTTSSGKRANRTRFTDYQIKVLQEFFENNSYPKDSDLEYLSKLLLLSPRVIVVWFQNARQKQRKIYENQPNNSLYESEEKKQNINYACKKCSLVFQRYYELIRHQKNHCFKEENNKKSAKAQIAAAQIAQNLSSEDSNSSIDINSAAAAALLAQHHPIVGATTAASMGKNTPSGREFSPITCNANTPPAESGSNNEHQKFICDKCKLTFSHFDSLREHQLMHLVNPNLHLPTDVHTTASTAAAAAYGPFGSILQSLQQAAHLQQAAVNAPSAAKKRKYSETSSNADDVSSQGAISLTGAEYENHVKKYNFLYQYFLQNEGKSDLRQQFHNQDSAELNMEFLANYYQQTELKKRNNYEFLFQYYLRNEQLTNVNFELTDNKPNIEFLLQYYQLFESKKFFQLEASPQRIYDGPLMQGDFVTTRHNSSSNNSSRPASNASNSSSPSGSGINEESNGGEVLNNIDNDSSPQLTLFNDAEHIPHSNGQLCNISNNNNDVTAANVAQNDRNHCKDTNDGLKSNNASKIEEQMDQLDGLQEVNNQLNSNSGTATLSESPHLSLETATGSYYQNLEDFLDATMIENHNQTLTFPMEAVKLQVEKVLRPPLPSPSIPVCTNQSTEPVTSNLDNNSIQKQANKRLRTTILPEQLNFLYECYQNESNPSRKMLEEISKKVSLKKRVVQVWFQNTRAKDKKSRNQQRQNFSNISDDNSNSSSVTNIQKANMSGLTPLSTATGSEASNDIIKDCNLCQVTQVDIQQHAFSMEHICKVKEIFAQTTAAAATLLNSGAEESDRETYRGQNEDHQKITQQKHQLALMMMAFQTQNLSNSTVFNDFEENLTESQTTVERNDNISSNPIGKYHKKSKRNALKKKRNTMKNLNSILNNTGDPIVASLGNENELILNLNANITDGTRLKTEDSDSIKVSRHSSISNTSQNMNERNDGNNNRNEDVDMHNNDEFVVLRTKRSDPIGDENDISKSRLLNCNEINVMESK